MSYPERLLAIDPGEDTGWALFVGGQLHRYGLCVPSAVPCYPVDVLVVEWPRERTGGRHISVAALLVLAAHAGEVIGRVPHGELRKVYPDAWKGTIPKPRAGAPYIIATRAARILGPLDADVWESTKHDTWDAIGLGLFALGRGKRGLEC